MSRSCCTGSRPPGSAASQRARRGLRPSGATEQLLASGVGRVCGPEAPTAFAGLTRTSPGMPPRASHTVADDPQLLAEWDHDANENLDPATVSSTASRRVWWRCRASPEHRWQAGEKHRGQPASRTGCPYCSGRRATRETSLAATHPQVAAEWHPTRNGRHRPDMVKAFTGLSVWCAFPVADDHEWKAPVSWRARGAGCPCCSGRQVTLSNCLATVRPDLAAQWHPSAIGALTRMTAPPAERATSSAPARLDGKGVDATLAAAAARTAPRPVLRRHASLSAERPELAAQWHRWRTGPSPQQYVGRHLHHRCRASRRAAARAARQQGPARGGAVCRRGRSHPRPRSLSAGA